MDPEAGPLQALEAVMYLELTLHQMRSHPRVLSRGVAKFQKNHPDQQVEIRQRIQRRKQETN